MSRNNIVLMVAEKPSVAKAMKEFLGRGKQIRNTQGKSKFNPIYEFEYPFAPLGGQEVTLRVTSCLGHIMGLKYPDECKNWSTYDIE
jgi:DNA topoisomerase IA